MAGSCVDDVAYYVGEENEFDVLKADYSKDYCLHFGSLVLEPGEEAPFGMPFRCASLTCECMGGCCPLWRREDLAGGRDSSYSVLSYCAHVTEFHALLPAKELR